MDIFLHLLDDKAEVYQKSMTYGLPYFKKKKFIAIRGQRVGRIIILILVFGETGARDTKCLA